MGSISNSIIRLQMISNTGFTAVLLSLTIPNFLPEFNPLGLHWAYICYISRRNSFHRKSWETPPGQHSHTLNYSQSTVCQWFSLESSLLLCHISLPGIPAWLPPAFPFYLGQSFKNLAFSHLL